jgi:hypothetical protein
MPEKIALSMDQFGGSGSSIQNSADLLLRRILPALHPARISVSFSFLTATMNQKSSLREYAQFVSKMLTVNKL